MSKIRKKKTSKNNLEKSLFLQDILKAQIPNFENLFKQLDVQTFSLDIHLQNYQIAALQGAIVAIAFYTQNADTLYEEYGNYELDLQKEQINTASFWMATGSGKSIIMIKLIALLHELFRLKILGKKPIMLLVPNDKILAQFEKHCAVYNGFQSRNIELRYLKDYESINHTQSSLFNTDIVFIGRSDLLDEAQNVGKDASAKRIDYKNFLREQGWIVLLDEAHKGDNKDSVRKSYIKALAKGEKSTEYPLGFIFNFSATFSDSFDLHTCAFNYNLEKFNKEGYGKYITILDSNLKVFKQKDADNEAKNVEAQKLRIMESFIIHCAIKLHTKMLKEELQSKGQNALYHNPLIIAVSDKVNTQNAGIKLYFKAILEIVKDNKDITDIALNLYEKLVNQNLYFDKNLSLDKEFLELVKSIDSSILRKEIFYVSESSMIEGCRIKSNNKELVFKAKNATQPFLLLNIGSIREWEKQYLNELGVESGEDLASGYYEHINEADSPIQIMMGSKVFSEGWDSNRVNSICFINIGSRNAKKYVLQTIGRGVRIEPFRGVKKRLIKSEKIDFSLREKYRDIALGIESLFIMATDNDAIKYILEGIESFIEKNVLSGFKKNTNLNPLLIAKYKETSNLQNKPYVISQSDFAALKEYIESFDEDVLLLSQNIKTKDMGFETLCKVKNKINNEALEDSIIIKGDTRQLNISNALHTLESYFHTKVPIFDGFAEMQEEICHFEKFSSTLEAEKIRELHTKIKEITTRVLKSESELKEELIQGKIDIDEYTQNLKQNIAYTQIDCYNYTLNANPKEHYYSPLLIDSKQDGKITYAIKEPSEIKFLEDLQNYMESRDNAFKNYEWCFSKIVENVDSIFIPYFDRQGQKYRKFYPDFIFWLQHKESKEYRIIFIDPKGLKHNIENVLDKIAGFKNIFADREFNFHHLGQIEINLYFYNKQPHTSIDSAHHITCIEDIFTKNR